MSETLHQRLHQLEGQVHQLQQKRSIAVRVVMFSSMSLIVLLAVGAANPSPAVIPRLEALEAHFTDGGSKLSIDNIVVAEKIKVGAGDAQITLGHEELTDFSTKLSAFEKDGGLLKVTARRFEIAVNPYTWKFDGNGAAYRVGGKARDKRFFTPLMPSSDYE